MSMIRFALVLRVAGLEMLAAVGAALFAVYGGSGYMEYMASDAASLPFTPLIYSFGWLPFGIAAILAVGLGFWAAHKARSI